MWGCRLCDARHDGRVRFPFDWQAAALGRSQNQLEGDVVLGLFTFSSGENYSEPD
jgi:hypothetical protein